MTPSSSHTTGTAGSGREEFAECIEWDPEDPAEMKRLVMLGYQVRIPITKKPEQQKKAGEKQEGA